MFSKTNTKLKSSMFVLEWTDGPQHSRDYKQSILKLELEECEIDVKPDIHTYIELEEQEKITVLLSLVIAFSKADLSSKFCKGQTTIAQGTVYTCMEYMRHYTNGHRH